MINNLSIEHRARIFKSISDKDYIYSCLGFYNHACIQAQFLNLNNLKIEFEVFSVHNITLCISLNEIKQDEIYVFSTSNTDFALFYRPDT